jgi:hypothetical protein
LAFDLEDRRRGVGRLRQLRVSARLWIVVATSRAESSAPGMNELRLVM